MIFLPLRKPIYRELYYTSLYRQPLHQGTLVRYYYSLLTSGNYTLLMIHVFGHYSPDTDATGSAIIWAWYLKEHTGADATPYVLGELNSETLFVLQRFGVSAPAILETLPDGAEVAIVDTNNPQELPENIHKAQAHPPH